MTIRAKGVAVLAVQLALVLSIAVKYAWERHTCACVWTRAVQFDPEQPLRGRYLALTLIADACALPLDKAEPRNDWRNGRKTSDVGSWQWQVLPRARDGALTAVLADDSRPEDAEALVLRNGVPCSRASLNSTTEFFIAEHAKAPFPLAKGEELWAEVTMPPSGPPRPVRLAVSDGRNFRVLALR
ncbi:MAG: hypothetical protein ABI147_02500 [Acidobacteriaceae bacterium]